MQIIDSNPGRLIDLPGTGPCPRPVDIDETVTGFETLKSLRIYSFKAGQCIEGESEGDEVFVVPVTGSIDLGIEGAHPASARLGGTGARALYMTPGHSYRLRPLQETVVAYARAAAKGTVATAAIAAPHSDTAETLRFRLVSAEPGADISLGGGPETLCYMISGSAAAAGQELQEGQTLALAKGESALLTAAAATEMLVVEA